MDWHCDRFDPLPHIPIRWPTLCSSVASGGFSTRQSRKAPPLAVIDDPLDRGMSSPIKPGKGTAEGSHSPAAWIAPAQQRFPSTADPPQTSDCLVGHCRVHWCALLSAGDSLVQWRHQRHGLQTLTQSAGRCGGLVDRLGPGGGLYPGASQCVAQSSKGWSWRDRNFRVQPLRIPCCQLRNVFAPVSATTRRLSGARRDQINGVRR